MNNLLKSDFISNALALLEQAIATNTFIDVEKANLELKDLSTGEAWDSLKQTICAFLNTDGGVAICGIRERDNKYILTGFDRKNEKNIVDLHTKVFASDDGQLPDLTDRIYFDYLRINTPHESKEVVAIAVYPLPDDMKYVSVKGQYYERKLTQDKKIPPAKLQQQKEYKQELEYAKEMATIENASPNDLSLDKINHYINLLTREIRTETLKPSLAKARQFLANQHFIKGEQVTQLGMLVCGADPFHFLSARVEVNAYYDTASDIGKDKKIFRSDVIGLMEETFRYIWSHIKIARTVREGGKSEPEYPEQLIRETINNALAHRDYATNDFVTVRVEPGQLIEIKNPGTFKEKIKIVHTTTDVEIRRLMPGIPESKNPKLASVLKVFDKIESQGRGMASLVNAALENRTDLPYYDLKDGTIALRIPTGQLVDEAVDTWLKGFERYISLKIKNQLTHQHKAVLAYFYKSELLNKKRLFTILLSESNNHFEVIDELKNAGILLLHPASTEYAPVYVLERTLTKTDFRDELSALMGDQRFIAIGRETKEVLNMTYLFSKFNQQALKAADITPEVYRRMYGKQIVAKTYESLGRKIRAICNQLQSMGLLAKNAQSAYTFNFNYQKNDNTPE